jgi:hypothetical protein
MRTIDDTEHIFGSVSSRGSFISREEKRLKREILDLQIAGEEARRSEVKKGWRIGRLF